MDMRMARDNMRHCDPLQSDIHVLLHPGESFAGVAFKVEALAEFRRNDQLEQAWVTGRLPGVQRLRDVDSLSQGRRAKENVSIKVGATGSASRAGNHQSKSHSASMRG